MILGSQKSPRWKQSKTAAVSRPWVWGQLWTRQSQD